MTLNFFVLLTLLKFGLSAPDPNIEVGVNVHVEDNGNNCCGDKSCIFGGIVYPHKCNLKDTCVNMQCIDGTWKFKGINKECKECKVQGDPHIYPYDSIVTPGGVWPKYVLNKTGEYVITQPGFTYPALFGVTGTSDYCNYADPKAGMCMRDINYYEPGINVELISPSESIAALCVGNPARDPACDIKVLVKKIIISPVGSSVQEVFGGFGGAILVFKHTDIGGVSASLNCMTIVGTKGVSVSLCQNSKKALHFYVWSMPSLKSPPKTHSDQLYGLCGTWTGNTATTFVLQNTTSIPTVDCLTFTYSFGWAWVICEEFSGSWELDLIDIPISTTTSSIG